jgi:uncharacterized protein
MSTAPSSSFKDSPDLSAGQTESTPARPGVESRRIGVFVGIVLTILLSANAFVCATWSQFFELPGWLWWQFIPGSLAVAFILSAIAGYRSANPLISVVYTVSAAWLGVLNLAFFAAVGCRVVDTAAWVIGSPLPSFEIAAVLFGAAFVAAVWGLINAAWLRITRVTVALPNLPEAWRGRTVALVTDLHLGHVSRPRFLRRVVARLRSAQPEAVFVSGDMFDGSPVGVTDLVAGWQGFSPARGVYYVAGNHDEFVDRKIFLDAVSGTGVRVLNNEKISVDGLQIVGVHDSEAEDPRELREILGRARLDTAQPSILLAHRPVNLAVAEEAGISLQLSGHTHHGQMWPWNLLVRRIYGPFAYGLHRLRTMWVYTSSGAGTWGPPMRVGTRSEIVLIRLEKT